MTSDLAMLGVSAAVVLWCAGLVFYVFAAERRQEQATSKLLTETLNAMLRSAHEDRRSRERGAQP